MNYSFSILILLEDNMVKNLYKFLVIISCFLFSFTKTYAMMDLVNEDNKIKYRMSPNCIYCVDDKCKCSEMSWYRNDLIIKLFKFNWSSDEIIINNYNINQMERDNFVIYLFNNDHNKRELILKNLYIQGTYDDVEELKISVISDNCKYKIEFSDKLSLVLTNDEGTKEVFKILCCKNGKRDVHYIISLSIAIVLSHIKSLLLT